VCVDSSAAVVQFCVAMEKFTSIRCFVRILSKVSFFPEGSEEIENRERERERECVCVCERVL
jgi:hypothetical protein